MGKLCELQGGVGVETTACSSFDVLMMIMVMMICGVAPALPGTFGTNRSEQLFQVSALDAFQTWMGYSGLGEHSNSDSSRD